ncbi:MAG: PFL family protein [Planctomycetaceae bacterium]|nr:PFL family protein [Planctomycetaceae bacterium]
MPRTDDILSTLRMVKQENLDVRTVTLGINLFRCIDRNLNQLCDNIYDRITSSAKDLHATCETVSTRYGIPIVNKRLAVTPIQRIGEGFAPEELVEIARTLDKAAAEVGVDLIGGYSALVHGGHTQGAINLIESLPEVLSTTNRVCSSVNVGTTKAGINMNMISLLGKKILDIAHATSDRQGFGAAKLVVFANAPEDNPFMAGAFHGSAGADTVIHIGVSGPGVVKRGLERFLEAVPTCSLDEIAAEIKSTAFRVTRVGELIGREVAARMGVRFGIVDLSLAPTPKIGDSIGEILELIGLKHVGVPGSTAVLALLNDAVKKGGVFASSAVGGLSGAFVPVMEDASLAAAVQKGYLTVEKLEAMTAVCSVGLDMVPVPGDISPETLAALMADEIAIGVFNNKTTATRIVPVPGKKAGEFVSFGGLFGESVIMPVPGNGCSHDFVSRGGHIPAPIQSLRN